MFLNPLSPGTNADIQVTTSDIGILNAWIDWNGDGDFDDAQEQIAMEDIMGLGVNVIKVSVPNSIADILYCRFRFTENLQEAATPKGFAFSGEVEDYALARIGDFVWLDDGSGGGAFNDGIQNGSEPGVDGITVNLLDGSGNVVTDTDSNPITTTTSGGGAYEFSGLAPGSYQIEFEPGANVFTSQNQGADDSVDSDADETTGRTATVTVDPAEDDDTVDAGFAVPVMDYGDAPDPFVSTAGAYPTLAANDGARHAAGGPVLGNVVDLEPDGQPTSNAAGDDTGGSDDEDGVTITTPVLPGTAAGVSVEVTGADGLLDAWIDFDADASWESTEQVFTNKAVTVGTNAFRFPVPANAVVGQTFSRFRVSTAGGLQPTGSAADGEVEDYPLSIDEAPPGLNFYFDDDGDLVVCMPTNQVGIFEIQQSTDFMTWIAATGNVTVVGNDTCIEIDDVNNMLFLRLVREL